MTLLLVGLNYQTAPLELREQFYLRGDELQRALIALQSGSITEVAILSTCNRLEIYAHTADTPSAADFITTYLERLNSRRDTFTPTQLSAHLQILRDQEAVRHLLRVAAGIESLVIGETEILGQVADALAQAQCAKTIGAILSRLFHDAIHTGKRARAETAISQHTMSVSHAAVLIAAKQILDLASANTLIVGAGRMAELAAKTLRAQGVTQIHIVNRTHDHAQALAARLGIQAHAWDQLLSALQAADLVITATSAPRFIISAADLAPKPARRVFVDLAVPRNIHADVRTLPDVCLFDIDNLQAVVEDHRLKRQSEVAQVEHIVESTLQHFLAWFNSRRAVSTVAALRQQGSDIAEAELIRAFNRLPDLSEHEREVLAQMAHRIVAKLLHAPTIALLDRAAHDEPHFTYLHAVRQLFDLKTDE